MYYKLYIIINPKCWNLFYSKLVVQMQKSYSSYIEEEIFSIK